MSVPVPSILQTYIPFPYPILSAFPVHFTAFLHKTNDTLSCPQRKKRTKTPKGTLYCPVHSLFVYTKGPIYCPQIRFPHINGAKKGITICPSYYVSVSERDNILSPLCTVYLRERDNIMSPYFCCVSPNISQEGQYIALFNTFPAIYLKGTIYCSLHARSA